MSTPGEGASVCGWGECEAVFSKLGFDEGVDGGVGIVLWQRLIGPVIHAFIDGCGFVLGVFGPDGTGVDPGFDFGDLIGGEGLAFRRHALVTGGGDALEERLSTRFGGNDGGAAFAAFESMWFGIEAEVGFLFFRAVAFDAALLEERANFAVEVLTE